MSACCSPTLHGWFVRERLFRIGLRHGPDCREQPGQIERIKLAQWWHNDRKVATGEVYE